MKKLISTMLLGSVLATAASADFVRVEAGAGAWGYTPSGLITYTDNYGTLTHTSLEKAQISAYAWMLIKHPIPFVPNLRLEYATVHDDGVGSGKYNGYTFPAGTPTTLDLTQYDIVPYYNILDNTFWTTIDLGLDIKVIQSEFTAKNAQLDLSTIGSSDSITKDYDEKATAPIPLAYVRARVEIPFTGIGFETDAKYISYDGDTVYDVRAKVDYTLDFIPVIQPGIELGYRAQKYDFTSEDKKTKVNMDYSGVYFGAMVRF